MKKTADIIRYSLLEKHKEESINIFLCGAETSNAGSIRGSIFESLKQYSKVNIVFPEWLFPNLLNGPDHDLLSLENELAKNVDLIIIPLEGIGTYCELGSFANYQDLINKILVINDIEYKTAKSFINEGPIKLIKKTSPNSILWEDFKNITEIVSKVRNKVLHFRKKKIEKILTNLFTFSTYVGQYLSFCPPIEKNELQKEIYGYVPEANPNHFEPVIEILLNKKYIKIENNSGNEILSCTNDGFHFYLTNLGTSISEVNQIYKLRAESLYERSKIKRKGTFQNGSPLF